MRQIHPSPNDHPYAITTRRTSIAIVATVATLATCLVATAALGVAASGLIDEAAAAQPPPSPETPSGDPVDFRLPVGSLEHASDSTISSPPAAPVVQFAQQQQSQPADKPTPAEAAPELTEADPELTEDSVTGCSPSFGTTWIRNPLTGQQQPGPDGINLHGTNTSADRWLAWGYSRDAGEGLVGLVDRMFYSDDQGNTWTEAILEVPADSIPKSSHCRRVLIVERASVSDAGIGVELWGYRVLDAHELLAERGLVPDGETVTGWSHGVDNTLVFALEGRGAVYRIVDGSLKTLSEAEQLVFTPEELGFTQHEWIMQCGDVETIRLLWSDGSTAQLA